jgi:hypothetical protein
MKVLTENETARSAAVASKLAASADNASSSVAPKA